ncbi:hypothetical protein Riv7116_4843 [Rivularia sp. PCC 7116]|nr:hypothetical protein Riv7116_4843 [Rivularia sp. PCC 7116]
MIYKIYFIKQILYSELSGIEAKKINVNQVFLYLLKAFSVLLLMNIRDYINS